MLCGEFVEPFLIHGTEAEHANRHAGRTEAAEIFAAHHGFAFFDFVVAELFFQQRLRVAWLVPGR